MTSDTRPSFTPGPWHATDDSPIDILAAGQFVCTISGSKSNPTSQADAHLIAAAPELYEALRGLVKYHDDLDCWHMNEYGHTCDSNPANEAASPGSPISVARTVLAKLMAGSVER